MNINRERPWSVKRAAKFLDVHPRTIEKYFEQGLEKTRIGGKVYTSRAAIHRFQQEDTNHQSQPAIWPGIDMDAHNAGMQTLAEHGIT